MVRVNQLIDRSESGRCGRSRIARTGTATVAAGNLDRSTDFYARIFGLRVESRCECGAVASARMSGPGGIRLVIRGRGDGVVRPGAAQPRLGFLVGDLDDVRESLWDSGVSVARDSGEPDQIFRHSHGRSLYIRDPDGNEIELVEGDRAEGRAPVDRGGRAGRWRLAPRRCRRATG